MDLSDASVAETSTKNINNSFTVRGMQGGPPPQHLMVGALQTSPSPQSRGAPHSVASCCWRWHRWPCAGVRCGLLSRDWLTVGWPCKGTWRWWLLQVITPFRKLILCAENRKEMEDWISALKSVQKWEIHEVMWAGGCASLQRGTPQEWGCLWLLDRSCCPWRSPTGRTGVGVGLGGLAVGRREGMPVGGVPGD